MSTWPEEVYQWFDEKTQNDDYDNLDNERAALETDAVAVAEYEARRADGCCGSVDEIIQVNGHNWLVGFNYGH